MTDMMPIGPLMMEHRLIMRAVAAMRSEAQAIRRTGKADEGRLSAIVDFIRTYADRCHHGKEEDILFRELAGKKLTPEHAKTMRELVEEHARGRKMTGMLESARERHARGEANAIADVAEQIEALCAFYPGHIETEDKRFFVPVMGYLSKAEMDSMLQEMRAFDGSLIHERYGKAVEALERRKT